ncbi:CTD small phosphatase-like protein 2 [Diplonema papillatum]|nr:CTD small phosphatase-like protein 2 [Diplonema papillatum]
MFAYQGAYAGTQTPEPISWALILQRLFPSLWREPKEELWDWDDDEDSIDDDRTEVLTACSYRSAQAPATDLALPALDPPGSAALTVVLDLDETLAFSREAGPVVSRPGLAELLAYFASTPALEPVVWTAGTRKYAQRVIAAIDPTGVLKHCVYRHSKWIDPPGAKARLLTGRPLDQTIIVDNTPSCVARNAGNGVVISDFSAAAGGDRTLAAVVGLLQALVASGLPVSRFVASSPDLKRLPVPDARGGVLHVYFLDERRWGGPAVDPASVRQKVGRDLLPGAGAGDSVSFEKRPSVALVPERVRRSIRHSVGMPAGEGWGSPAARSSAGLLRAQSISLSRSQSRMTSASEDERCPLGPIALHNGYNATD